jgi:hypothetical protein
MVRMNDYLGTCDLTEPVEIRHYLKHPTTGHYNDIRPTHEFFQLPTAIHPTGLLLQELWVLLKFDRKSGVAKSASRIKIVRRHPESHFMTPSSKLRNQKNILFFKPETSGR